MELVQNILWDEVEDVQVACLCLYADGALKVMADLKDVLTCFHRNKL